MSHEVRVTEHDQRQKCEFHAAACSGDKVWLSPPWRGCIAATSIRNQARVRIGARLVEIVQRAGGNWFVQRVIDGKINVVRSSDGFLVIQTPQPMRLQFMHEALASGGADQQQASAGESYHCDCP